MPAAASALDGSLDHVGVMVRDLAAGAARWDHLGFALTPVSRQRGKLPGRDDEGPWASANRCAVFERGYLELIGLVDPVAFNPWARFMDRFEGIHLVALRVPNADHAYAELAARDAQVHPTVQRERRIDLAGREETMRFRNVFSRDEAHPEARYIVIEHQTPQFLWQADAPLHPNGARALLATTVVAANAAAQIERLGALLGVAPHRTPEGAMRFEPSGGGAIDVMTPADFAALYAETPPTARAYAATIVPAYTPTLEPAYSAITVEFTDRRSAARLMEARGAIVHRRGERWFLDRATAGGFILELV